MYKYIDFSGKWQFYSVKAQAGEMSQEFARVFFLTGEE